MPTLHHPEKHRVTVVGTLVLGSECSDQLVRSFKTPDRNVDMNYAVTVVRE